MTLRGDTTQHPEPQFAPDDHHAVLARILETTPELVPQALARLIASERESARAEAFGQAAAAIEVRRDICRNAHGKACIGAVAYSDSADLVRNLGRSA